MENKYPKFTEKDLEKYLKELMPKKPNFVAFQGCLEKGITKRTEYDLGMCSNPDCTSCREIDKALKEYYGRSTKK
jgi:hypothetical protein